MFNLYNYDKIRYVVRNRLFAYKRNTLETMSRGRIQFAMNVQVCKWTTHFSLLLFMRISSQSQSAEVNKHLP